MWRLGIFVVCAIALLANAKSYAYTSVFCANLNNYALCYSERSDQSEREAEDKAQRKCSSAQSQLTCFKAATFKDVCASFYFAHATTYMGNATTLAEAQAQSRAKCERNGAEWCRNEFHACDTADEPVRTTVAVATPRQEPTPAQKTDRPFSLGKYFSDDFRINPSALFSGILFGIGVIIVLLLYAKREQFINLIIHANLPTALPNPSDDIQVLFKRSQRLNWYGRVIFGITAQLGMSEKQMALVRRYRLGRVIAFDSLRRQKQNELALLHLQLAAEVEAKPVDRKPLSQFIAVVIAIFAALFFYFRALFSFLLGFLFLRVRLANLVRGAHIESKDLVILLQAQDAIQETASYLKQYLTTAETFDGREERFEPE